MAEYNFGSIMNRDFILELKRMAEDVNVQGKTIQDLVAEGQLTEEQYANLINMVNGLLKSGEVSKTDLTPELRIEVDKVRKKIDKGDVSIYDINKNKGKFDQTYLTQDLIDTITGSPDANILSEVADGSVTTPKIANKAVLPSQTTFSENSKNMFNKNDVVQDLFISGGVENTNTSYVSSQFIPVRPSSRYKRSHNSTVNMYNANFEYIRAESNNSNAFDTTVFTAYIRVSLLKTDVNVYQLESGDTTTDYVEYGILIDDLKVQNKNMDAEMLSKIDDKTDKNFTQTLQLNPVIDDVPLSIFSFLDDSDNPSALNASITKDFSAAINKNKWGWRVSGSSTTVNFNAEFATPKTQSNISAIDVLVYLEDASKVDSISLFLKTQPGTAFQWQRNSISNESPLVDGLNVLRFLSTAGVTTHWGEYYGLRLQFNCNTATNFSVLGVFGEVRPKAQILFVEDGGYVEFLEHGYPDLKSRGIPTTWALNPGRLGQGRIITESDVDELSKDYMSAFSYHSWASEVHATMTAQEVQDNAIRCERWLQKKGIQPKYPFRGAITQNNAPNHEGLQEIVEAYSSYSGRSGYETFPFSQRHGFARMAVHGISLNERFDEIFDVLKKTRGLVVLYTHGVGPRVTDGLQSGEDASFDQWNYFLQKIDEGQSEGWLEGVSYDMLRTRFKKAFGGAGYNVVLNQIRGK